MTTYYINGVEGRAERVQSGSGTSTCVGMLARRSDNPQWKSIDTKDHAQYDEYKNTNPDPQNPVLLVRRCHFLF